MASPSGYDRHYTVRTPRGDCTLGVGFDTTRGDVTRFLVQLQYGNTRVRSDSVAIARIDHNQADATGHDLYAEGLHVDLTKPDGTEIKVRPPHSQLPPNGGNLIRTCIDYFRANVDYFVHVYRGTTHPKSPPTWP